MKTKINLVSSALLAVVMLFSVNNDTFAQPGVTWTSRTSAADNNWFGITYGNGLFVAVAYSGTGNRVMTSPNGINWTIRTSAADNEWNSVAYGNGVFVAVASTGTGNRVMTSPDGITWTSRTSAADNDWFSVTYANGLFVALASTGTANQIMTSPDGVTWTLRTTPTSQWTSLTYGNGLFVAVAVTGTPRVMTSPDGINWTGRTSASNNQWYGIAYGNGVFVAVASSGSGDRVMTSTNGETWTSRNAANENTWTSVTFGDGVFVAVSNGGAGSRVMTSSDGITWTGRTAATGNKWASVTYGNGLFAAVSDDGTGNRVMTSGTFVLPVDLASFSVSERNGTHILLWKTANESNNQRFDIERSSNAKAFETIGTVDGAGNSNSVRAYQFTDASPLAGINYYRLKQIDTDGKFEYSRMIQIENELQPVVALAPNPVSEQANISIITYLSQTVQYRILDHTGRVMQQKSTRIAPGNNVLPINTALLANGIYVVDVKGEWISAQKKIVKN